MNGEKMNTDEKALQINLDAKKYGITALATGDGMGLSYIQIDAILELQLHRLTQLSVDEILKELAQIRERIAELEEILASDKKLKAVIISELREVVKSYGDDRRTQIVDRVEEINLTAARLARQRDRRQ